MPQAGTASLPYRLECRLTWTPDERSWVSQACRGQHCQSNSYFQTERKPTVCQPSAWQPHRRGARWNDFPVGYFFSDDSAIVMSWPPAEPVPPRNSRGLPLGPLGAAATASPASCSSCSLVHVSRLRLSPILRSAASTRRTLTSI